MDVADVGRGAAQADRDPRLALRPLPARSAVALAPRRARRRDRAASSPTTPTCATRSRRSALPYHHVPVDEGHASPRPRRALLELLAGSVDLVVLARYMQILSGDFLEQVGVPVINIHHSFLPAFAGAGPYRARVGARRQADRRDRPLRHRGARRRPDHRAGRDPRRATATTSRRSSGSGADIERSVLARAVQWHCEDRVLHEGNTTVVLLEAPRRASASARVAAADSVSSLSSISLRSRGIPARLIRTS